MGGSRRRAGGVSATVRLAGIAVAVLLTAAAQRSPRPFVADFDAAWREVASTYAYFDLKATRWDDVPRLYRADAQRVRTRGEFVALLERVLDELYDPHLQLTTNTASSPRLVPSGADLWAEWIGADAIVTDVRADSDALRAGIRAGMVVLDLNGAPLTAAVEARLGRSYPHATPAAREWALRAVLAGRHNAMRALRLRDGSAVRTVTLPAADQFATRAATPLTVTRLDSGIAHIRINDSLGDDATITALDAALLDLRDAPGLLIDLRNTPSGGNTNVARGLLGRFVEREVPYQKHVLPAEERSTGVRRSWLELVTPRAPFTFRRPVAVLVGHWTGSMGEGLALGFDGAAHATIVGTAMAGLLGATYHVTLPNTGIGVNIPAERLYHVDGRPREAFRPAVLVDPMRAAADDDDPARAAAVAVLRR
jgi:C-terminal processing protease CtpA/Prc